MSDINNIRPPRGDNYKMEPPCMTCTKTALCEYHEKQKATEARFAKLIPTWPPKAAANPESPDGSEG